MGFVAFGTKPGLSLGAHKGPGPATARPHQAAVPLGMPRTQGSHSGVSQEERLRGRQAVLRPRVYYMILSSRLHPTGQ